MVVIKATASKVRPIQVTSMLAIPNQGECDYKMDVGTQMETKSNLKIKRLFAALGMLFALSPQGLYAENITTANKTKQIQWSNSSSSNVSSNNVVEDEDVDYIDEVAVDVRKLPSRTGSLSIFSAPKTALVTAQEPQYSNQSLEGLVLQLSQEPLALNARTAMVLDANTGEELYNKHADQVAPMASITKLMTAMVTADARLDMHELITLEPEDFIGAKKASSKLRAGDQLNRAELLLIALMKSENPAAAALARTYPKGKDRFIQAMNDKARSLGMRTAFFNDPTGLDARNVASARDLAKMVRVANQYGVIRSFSSTQQYDFDLGDRVLHAKNTNAIVREGGWDIGVSKTGYISEAGRCVVMQAQINHRPAVIVVMGARSSQSRTGDAKQILNWLLNKAN